MAKERSSKYIRLDKSPLGGIGISEGVVAVIAGYAAMEVEGVSAMAGNITAGILGRAGMNMLSKGVRITVDEEDPGVRIDLAVIVKYGYPIPDICTAVQDKVKSTVESMTGLNVPDVNIRIAHVCAPEAQKGTE